MNKAIELITRTLCDLQPKFPTHGAYLYCQTEDNHNSVFQAAQFLINHSYTSKLLILGADAESGYPGFEEWKRQLLQLGILTEQITSVNKEETSELNTLVESEALIRFTKKQSYGSIFVVAPPFQQLRAFMTAVTVSMREYPELLIYSHPGAAMHWQEEVVHSQGTLMAKRRELIQEELDRIEKYQNKGDLASYEQVLNYLNRRDKHFYHRTESNYIY